MKPLIATAAACLLLTFSTAPATPASAQTRTRRSTPQRRRAPAPAASSRLDQTRFNAQRLELAGLSKDLTRFLYVYGRLSKDLELTGAQTGSADATAQAKAGVIRNIGVMRDRLDQLEGRFRFEAGLATQYQTLRGVSARADEAAQQAAANRFDQAGRTLLAVSEKLTDVLLEMQ
ncbi:MAG: hypothetical protein LC795_18340 [Acidobacteria bacterium]|nr:hypothetical protein [Acidobacteriota bacterium]MCA1621223.1 hypothetical protein [Acidobacteriota bacterium]